MTRIEELLRKLSVSSYSSDYQEAKTKRICILCNEPAEDFQNKGAELEYSISAICQKCQDRYFKGGK
jgi:hypothetical protein